MNPLSKEDAVICSCVVLAAALIFFSVVGLRFLDTFRLHAANKSRNDSAHVLLMTRQAEAQERSSAALEAKCSL